MDSTVKSGILGGLSAACLWVVRFPGRVSRLEEGQAAFKDELADVKATTVRVEGKVDKVTEILLEKL